MDVKFDNAYKWVIVVDWREIGILELALIEFKSVVQDKSIRGKVERMLKELSSK